MVDFPGIVKFTNLKKTKALSYRNLYKASVGLLMLLRGGGVEGEIPAAR